MVGFYLLVPVTYLLTYLLTDRAYYLLIELLTYLLSYLLTTNHAHYHGLLAYYAVSLPRPNYGLIITNSLYEVVVQVRFKSKLSTYQ